MTPAHATPILVTGGTGFVGRSVVEALAGSGASVRVLSRSPLPADMTAGGTVVHFRGDVMDEGALKRAAAGAGALIHLAAAVSGDGEALYRTNVEGSRRVARAARDAGVSRLVHVSSAGVYGESGSDAPLAETAPPAPHNEYGKTKLLGERALTAELEGSGVAWAVLRPYGVYGPRRLQFFLEVKRRRLWIYGPTEVILHPTHVDDVVSATLAALGGLEREGVRGQTFNVGGDRPLSHFAFVQLAARALGVRVFRLATPARLNAVLERLPPWPHAPYAVRRLARRRIVYAANTDKAKRILGWKPLPLEQAIEATVRAGQRAGEL